MFASNSVDSKLLAEYLNATFHLQKCDIASGIPVKDLKKNWPGLMTFDGHMIFINKLLAVFQKEKLLTTLEQQGERFQTCIEHLDGQKEAPKQLMASLTKAKEDQNEIISGKLE